MLRFCFLLILVCPTVFCKKKRFLIETSDAYIDETALNTIDVKIGINNDYYNQDYNFGMCYPVLKGLM